MSDPVTVKFKANRPNDVWVTGVMEGYIGEKLVIIYGGCSGLSKKDYENNVWDRGVWIAFVKCWMWTRERQFWDSEGYPHRPFDQRGAKQ